MEELKLLYQKRATDFHDKATAFQNKYQQYSLVRLFTFLIGLALIIYCWATFEFWGGVPATFLFLLAFAKFVAWHRKIQALWHHHEALELINEEELKALNYNYAQFGNGADFQDANHPYSIDLDIFGDYSFFQYCNRTATSIGNKRLAQYLSLTTTTEEILQRQAATTELKEALEWRQNFQAYGMATEDELSHVILLKKWLHEKPFISNNRLWKFAIFFAPFWTIISLLLFIFYLPWQIAILLLIPPGWVLKKTLEQVNHTHNQTTHAEKILAFYAKLIQHIEGKEFETPKLKKLRAAFFENNNNASSQISKLSYIIRQLNVRLNPFAIFLNLSVLWDLRYVRQLEKWKATMKDQLPNWFEALEEFEALLSFGTLHFNNPDWCFPEIQTSKQFIGKALGHPLIAPDKRICNDLELPTDGHIKLITGSNMAGKSTFLRTAGLNIVLAMSGAPVCAKSLSLPILQVYSSMRTQDALHESTSSFYAELKRLKFIIEAVEAGDNIFFLLDEILKGTNSNDRHTGSKSLIRQLIRDKGSGLIATHDLDLGALEAKSKGAIENLRMEVEIKNDKLFFDYKMKKGVSESFNATLLMKNMGIKIE